MVLNVTTPPALISKNLASVPFNEKAMLSSSGSVALAVRTLVVFSATDAVDAATRTGISLILITVTATAWVSFRPAVSVTTTLNS